MLKKYLNCVKQVIHEFVERSTDYFLTFYAALPTTNPNRIRPRTAITETVVVGYENWAVVMLKTSCRTSHDTDRVSLPEGADSVQVTRQIGGTAPDNTDVAILTREIFIPCTIHSKIRSNCQRAEVV